MSTPSGGDDDAAVIAGAVAGIAGAGGAGAGAFAGAFAGEAGTAAMGGHKATFIEDHSYEDDIVLPPMVSILKGWSLRNTGARWQPGVQVVHRDGPLLSAPPAITIATTDAGQSVIVTVPMVTPAEAGTYKSTWTLMDASGHRFGPSFWMVFKVDPRMGCAFVSDVTIPDGKHVTQGHSFAKTWRLRNTGQAAWAGVHVVHVSGPRMGATRHAFNVQPICPGKTADVTITFTPSETGPARSTWQLVNSLGKAVGAVFYVDVVVDASADQAEDASAAEAAGESKEPAGDPIHVHVRTLTGSTHQFLIDPSAVTAEDFKRLIQGWMGAPPEQQRLIYAGRELQDPRKMSDYNVVEGTVVHLILRLRGKPVVYLYPQEELSARVQVKLAPHHTMTTTWPRMDSASGWDVVAKPGSRIRMAGSGRSVPYLFWEAAALSTCPEIPLLDVPAPTDGDSASVDPIVKAGFHRPTVVAREALGDWLDASLARVGLSARERCDMVTYWLPQMETHEWTAVRFLAQSELGGSVATLDVTPAPTAALRVFMVWKGVAGPLDGVPTVRHADAADAVETAHEAAGVAAGSGSESGDDPETPAWRAGAPFALVEWGGSSLDDGCV